MDISQLFSHSQNHVNLGDALWEAGTTGEVLVSEPAGHTVVTVIPGSETGAEGGTFRRITVTKGWAGRIVHTFKYYFGTSYRAKVKYSRQTVLEEILKACRTLEAHVKQPSEGGNDAQTGDLGALEGICREINKVVGDERNFSRGSLCRRRVGLYMATIHGISSRVEGHSSTVRGKLSLSKPVTPTNEIYSVIDCPKTVDGQKVQSSTPVPGQLLGSGNSETGGKVETLGAQVPDKSEPDAEKSVDTTKN